MVREHSISPKLRVAYILQKTSVNQVLVKSFHSTFEGERRTFLLSTAQTADGVPSNAIPALHHLLQALVTQRWVEATLNDCK